MTFNFPAICLVTDRRRLTDPTDHELVRLVSSAAAAGIDLVHLRERERDDRDLLSLTRRLVAATRGSHAKVVVNDRVDIAIAGGAAGVHLRADSFGAERVREMAPPGFVVGRSGHSTSEAASAERSGVDYLVFGTVYPTSSKTPDAPVAGIGALEEACRAVSVPVLAIGGVTTDKLAGLAAAGAAGVAAIGLFTEICNSTSHGDLEGALADLVATIRNAFSAHGSFTRSLGSLE